MNKDDKQPETIKKQELLADNGGFNTTILAAQKIIKKRDATISELKEEIKDYREALEFYGNKDNWSTFTWRSTKFNKITFEDLEKVGFLSKKLGGKRARQVLEKYKRE